MEENTKRLLNMFRSVLVLLTWIVLLPIFLYRYMISPFLGQHCRFYPSCSAYSITAIRNHGIIRGLFLTINRLLKCHPWHPGGVDHSGLEKERNYR